MNEKALQRLEYDKIKEKVMDYALSYVGKKHVEQMMPMDSVKVVRSRLDETAEAKNILQNGASVPIPALEGMEKILSLLGTGYVFGVNDFTNLYLFLTSCSQLIKYMATKAQLAPRVSSYAASMYDATKLKNEIEQCIRHGQVVDSASKDLLKVRKRIVVFEERLKRQLDSIMNKYRSIMQENVISTRNGRYVIPIKKEHRKQVAGSVLDESASGQTVYMEPTEISTVQFELTALKAEEEREVTKVLMQLSAIAEEYTYELTVNVETVGMYDFLFAKAKYALAIGGANVELNEKGIIDVKEARHPLLGPKMVPLHMRIGREYKSLIITGPNTGGKTLTLKTIGLLTMMVQSGLLVPVQEGSRFAIFRNIAVDIGDGQSIEQALSTFSAHIHNVLEILQITDASTLVLIDEMATGTDPGEGVALSIAILEELHRRGATVIVNTHFNEIKNFASATAGFQNARMEFDEETLQPLYRLRIGEAGQSYAFLIALKLGIPSEMIQRSREITRNGFTTTTTTTTTERLEQYQDIEQEEYEAPHYVETRIIEKPEEVEVEVEEERREHLPQEISEKVADTPAKPERDKPFAVGDCVFISYLGRTGIVFAAEDSKGIVGVMIQNQKYKINKKRLVLHIEGKELYPADYDMDIVFETKENRKKRKMMSRKHVEGLSIETKREG
ncbi:endonuclease MutS2 [Brevibacillus porteri]|uniref:DNA mismatch repair protein MutS n=1 Tax=Brevibacillus porteri TaxID=2126350 RepID=A0ABX5FTL0_9BACL|nr:DNA mismatch repair protein MutS [Brevibacillus porteri]MED1797229.1 DNA mismatch repair protein MutS [Brevibacillus porteri]MED2133762.1 DNA mismatch repair protein MutS [Brevibacillus porteri]MED2746892.1 DNA mismatch repair protein MutS [Brevibacillus porteri]MED2816030.1 DNA mismatch repair protein MutS [Brevibacillus porteri]MED2894724.1 DNA mismatch repair protein MutS [Brevibacillus porteri]